ncbi:MAG TPA: protease inhibitor I42 family protein, partial [Ktedonobacterales bacterium]|nr:protease inhibitor I42 family protein [Ktedonobacterales bacterium]
GSAVMLELDEAAHDTEATLRVGQELLLRLPEQPTTGFQWEVTVDGAPACALVDTAFEPPAGPPGGSGRRVWRFRAIQAGAGRIALRYGRPWEAAAPTARAFALRLRVLP